MKKDIIVNATAEENRVAILDNNKLEEFYVERTSANRLVGSVYKGRVESIMSGIGAAFVNIGLGKNGFLYVDDVVEEGSPYSDIVKEEMGDNFGLRKKAVHRVKISKILKKGQELLVQVIKEPLGTKGARLTAHITLPGRYLVFMAHEKHRGVSKKIKDYEERKRLKDVMDQLKLPEDAGIIARTDAANHKIDELRKEAQYLYKLYSRIKKLAAGKSAPALIHEEYGLVQRIARDTLTADVRAMVIDSKIEYKRTSALLRMISPVMRHKLKLYKENAPIFEKFNIAEEIEKIYKRRVQLPSKGYIIIEPTEGLVTIDVNSGKFSGKNPEETTYIVNKEAAVEIARQLKLRDIGGIIVIDFIDMESRNHKNGVLGTMIHALKNDKARTKVLNFSSIGLVEMTRQRMRKSLESVSYHSCPYCSGRGTVKSLLTMSIEILRQLEKKLSGQRHKKVEIVVNPSVKEHLLQNYKKTLNSLGRRSRCNIVVIDESYLHIEDFRINIA
ncbi:MAG: Rne/Rng family ribonuclease [Candidatus Omnitrophota bacterium]|nr:Rne/Rng family ribonuclease [Candidatus Omnitrophota bacterium]